MESLYQRSGSATQSKLSITSKGWGVDFIESGTVKRNKALLASIFIVLIIIGIVAISLTKEQLRDGEIPIIIRLQKGVGIDEESGVVG